MRLHKVLLFASCAEALPYESSRWHSAVIVSTTNNVSMTIPAELYGTLARTLEGELISSLGDSSLCQSNSTNLGDTYVDKIVLLEHSKCSLLERAERLQKARAKAVVIHDGGLPWLRDDWIVPLPAAFVSERSFFVLISASPIDIRISLTEPELLVYDILLCIFFCIIFLCACIITLLNPCAHRSAVASFSAISSFPTHPWARGKPPQPFPRERTATISSQTVHVQSHRPVLSECVICLESFKDGDVVLSLPCDHDYHSTCITPWLTREHCCCPICKADVCRDVIDERTPLLPPN